MWNNPPQQRFRKACLLLVVIFSVSCDSSESKELADKSDRDSGRKTVAQKEPIKSKPPTDSEIVNLTPIIAPVREPTYSQWSEPYEGGYGDETQGMVQISTSVEYLTSAEYEVIDRELTKYIEGLGYEMNPDRGHFYKGDAEVSFLYDTSEGKNRVSLTHYRIEKRR